MSKNEKTSKMGLGHLFWTLFKINAVTFGGGYTIVPVIRDEFVNKQKAISEDEMMDLVALGQSGPGAMAINTSILLGYRLQGLLGSLVAVTAAALPCLISITIISLIYAQIRDNHWVAAALRGMSGGISAIMALTVINMARSTLKSYRNFSAFMMISAFILAKFFHIKTVLVIIYCAIMGIAVFSLVEKEAHP